MQIEKTKAEDLEELSDLFFSVFESFIADDYLPAGIEEFKKSVQPESLKKRLDENQLSYVAKRSDGKILGGIFIRDSNHISLLFVDPFYQNRGIGRMLFNLALKDLSEQKGKPQVLTVNSSPYGETFYKRLGFTRTGGPQYYKSGMLIIPMILRLNREDREGSI